MDKFDVKPSGGWRTNGMEMLGVKLRTVPGGRASRPSSVIHTRRFCLECGRASAFSSSSCNDPEKFVLASSKLLCRTAKLPSSDDAQWIEVTISIRKNQATTFLEVWVEHSHGIIDMFNYQKSIRQQKPVNEYYIMSIIYWTLYIEQVTAIICDYRVECYHGNGIHKRIGSYSQKAEKREKVTKSRTAISNDRSCSTSLKRQYFIYIPNLYRKQLVYVMYHSI